MRRMLDPTKVGGLPSTIEFDKDGNRKVSKDLGVGGKLKLKSLVSSTNPDGDITKELGGGGGGTPRHVYMIDFTTDSCYYMVYTTKDYNFPIGQPTERIADFQTNDEYKDLRSDGWHPAAGYYQNIRPAIKLQISNNSQKYTLWIYNTSSSKYTFIEMTSLNVHITKLF